MFVSGEAELLSKIVVLFRVIAVAEALSWAALLAGMFAKYVLGQGDGGVPVVGMIHGVLFVAYVAVTLLVSRLLRWDASTLVLAGLSGVLPLCTWPFELWALRTGKLDAPAMVRYGGVGLYQTA